MLALLVVFLARLAVILASSSPVPVARPRQRRTATQPASTVALRLLQGDTRVWVKEGYGEQPLIAGGVVTLASELSLGRAPGNDIRLEDPFASSFHARIRSQRQGVLIEDLGTTNGTRVNGVRITTPVRAEPGDIVDVGSTSFAIEE
jgi:hypothetical protein